MIDNKTVLAIIPARGGSKRLPNKNILLFEKKNIELNSQIQILNDRINRLEFQKNAISKEIKNLQNNISEKEKIIENLKDKLHH